MVDGARDMVNTGTDGAKDLAGNVKEQADKAVKAGTDGAKDLAGNVKEQADKARKFVANSVEKGGERLKEHPGE